MLLPRLVYTPQVEASMGWPRWLHSKGEDYGHRACLTGETWATCLQGMEGKSLFVTFQVFRAAMPRYVGIGPQVVLQGHQGTDLGSMS